MPDRKQGERAFPHREGNEMPERARALDWSKTPLGPMDAWSPALKLAYGIVMSSAFPMALRWGPDFAIIYNDGYRLMLGEKHPAALGQAMRDVWPEVLEEIEPLHLRILSGESGSIYTEDTLMRLQRFGGRFEDSWFTFSYSPVPDTTAPTGVGGVLITVFETTSRVRTEARLREAEEALRGLNQDLEKQVEARTRELDRVWNNSRDIILVVGPDGMFQAVSPAWTKVLGHDPAEIVGHNFVEFIAEPDIASAQAGFASAISGDNLTSFEVRLRHKDGEPRWLSWHTNLEGDLIYAYGRDVTARKAAAVELAQAQEALRQAQKMEAVGQLTGGIAHDFNNMLAVVIAGIDIANRRLKRGEAGAEQLLESAREGATRAATLTQRLLAFSRQSPLAPRVVNLNELVASMSELLQRTLAERISLETVLAGGLWRAFVDANELESALINLALNGRDAMPGGGKLTIETANVYLDERYAVREIGMKPGQYVMVAVTDVGEGIPAEIIDKVFDPFFTTKPVGKGTGLGLSMVYGFAKQSGGHVRIYSEPSQGTSVKLYLPRHFGEGVVEAPKPAGIPAAATGSEVILLVEDEDRVRQMSSTALRELGYTVHEASSGEQALEMFDRIGPIDALFTDIVMGGITGRQLADQLRVRRPDLKVLYTTGYTRNAVVHNGVLDPGVALLTKPFSIEDLALKLRSVLDA